MREINYRWLPEHMREGMKRYIEHGIAPGSFLTAILCNDFMAAASRADQHNLQALGDYAMFLYNEAPAGCHSSESNFKEWLEHRGLSGLAERAARGSAGDAAGETPPRNPPSSATGD